MKDWQLHVAAGALIALLAVVGFGREVLQHDWTLTGHQWAEAIAWPAGGLAVLGLVLGVLELRRRRRK